MPTHSPTLRKPLRKPSLRLIEALEDDSERVLHHVAFALEKIGTPEAKQALEALSQA